MDQVTCEATIARVRPPAAASRSAASVCVVVAAVADRRFHDLDAQPVAEHRKWPGDARVLERRGDRAVAGPPVDRSEGKVDALGGGVGQGHQVHVSAQDGGHHGAGLVHALEEFLKRIAAGAPDCKLSLRHLGHRRGCFGRDGAGRAGVEVDACPRRREDGPERRQPLAVGGRVGVDGGVCAGDRVRSIVNRWRAGGSVAFFARVVGPGESRCHGLRMIRINVRRPRATRAARVSRLAGRESRPPRGARPRRALAPGRRRPGRLLRGPRARGDAPRLAGDPDRPRGT